MDRVENGPEHTSRPVSAPSGSGPVAGPQSWLLRLQKKRHPLRLPLTAASRRDSLSRPPLSFYYRDEGRLLTWLGRSRISPGDSSGRRFRPGGPWPEVSELQWLLHFAERLLTSRANFYLLHSGFQGVWEHKNDMYLGSYPSRLFSLGVKMIDRWVRGGSLSPCSNSEPRRPSGWQHGQTVGNESQAVSPSTSWQRYMASRALAFVPCRLAGPGITLTSSLEASGPLPSSVLGLGLQLCDSDLQSLFAGHPGHQARTPSRQGSQRV